MSLFAIAYYQDHCLLVIHGLENDPHIPARFYAVELGMALEFLGRDAIGRTAIGSTCGYVPPRS